MKKIIILILIVISLSSCRVCCNSEPKHYNARNLTDRVCIDVPTIEKITDVCGKEVQTLSDGVYIVILSNGERVKIIN